MFTKYGRILLAVLVIVALSCSIALAAKPAKKAAPIPVSPIEQDANLANSIAKILGFSVDSDKITALREKNYGYGEMALLYSLSHISRKPSSDIITMRDSKMGWGEIAKQLGVSVGQGMSGVSKIMKEMDMDQETDKLKEAIDKEPKPGKDKSSKK